MRKLVRAIRLACVFGNAAQDVACLVLPARPCVQLLYQVPHGPFMKTCFLDKQCPAHTVSWVYSLPDKGLSICFCWLSWCSSQPIFPARQCPTECPRSLPLSVPAACPNLASSSNWLRVHSVPSARSLIQTLNSIDLNIRWEMLLIAGPQLKFIP